MGSISAVGEVKFVEKSVQERKIELSHLVFDGDVK